MEIVKQSKLAAALCKAQATMEGAVKDATNPHFKSKYADLESVWAACRKPLTDNGLSVVQTTLLRDGMVLLQTTLLHESGEYLTGEYPIQVKDQTNPQQLGSAITYARRYALAAIAGVNQTDDDGNLASRREPVLYSGDLPMGFPMGATAVGTIIPTPNGPVIRPLPQAVEKTSAPKQVQSVRTTSQAQKMSPDKEDLLTLKHTAKAANWSTEDVTRYMKHKFNVDTVGRLSMAQFSTLISDINDTTPSYPAEEKQTDMGDFMSQPSGIKQEPH